MTTRTRPRRTASPGNAHETHRMAPRSVSGGQTDIVGASVSDTPSAADLLANLLIDPLVNPYSTRRWKPLCGYEKFFVLSDDGLLYRYERPRRRGGILPGGLLHPQLMNGTVIYVLDTGEGTAAHAAIRRGVRRLVRQHFGELAGGRCDPWAVRRLVDLLRQIEKNSHLADDPNSTPSTNGTTHE